MPKAVLNVPSAEPKDIRWFYDKYAAMLLGYINGIVQDHQKSEDHLITILTSFSENFGRQEKSQLSIWLELRQYAQNKLASVTAKDYPLAPSLKKSNGNLDLLDDLQKQIFCAVYYHGKSISYLALTLGSEEDEIRNQLKLSIDKMRRSRGN
ncbi:hypothetical protein G7074_05440 [Pedobacter sp. HDW13]|uniref:hypothetical protein n=1 Tax=unclassified Pedobacter TaxID=2628915 RepID=UPI000F5AF244|nr:MULTISPECIES: hypothetical protein [unclassified Pedobacter]QIL38772.1 hypothetical protein G7074_05440 [Pedobacter sp. HDW13]RQO80061.1 hypothetical protein DBR40_00110 [Pedobacter sp. KBW01]